MSLSVKGASKYNLCLASVIKVSIAPEMPVELQCVTNDAGKGLAHIFYHLYCIAKKLSTYKCACIHAYVGSALIFDEN